VFCCGEVCVFSVLEIEPQGQCFDSIEKIQTESQDAMKTLKQNDFQQYFRTWKSHWDSCTIAEGDYFEEDGEE